MTCVVTVVFWVSLAAVVWTYAGYPLLLLALARLRRAVATPAGARSRARRSSRR